MLPGTNPLAYFDRFFNVSDLNEYFEEIFFFGEIKKTQK